MWNFLSPRTRGFALPAALAAALALSALAVAQPAQAQEWRRQGGFNGYKGWGGLFRPNNDVGWGPTYMLGFIVEEPEEVYVPRPAPRPRRAVHRRRHRAVLRACAPKRPVERQIERPIIRCERACQ